MLAIECHSNVLDPAGPRDQLYCARVSWAGPEPVTELSVQTSPSFVRRTEDWWPFTTFDLAGHGGPWKITVETHYALCPDGSGEGQPSTQTFLHRSTDMLSQVQIDSGDVLRFDRPGQRQVRFWTADARVQEQAQLSFRVRRLDHDSDEGFLCDVDLVDATPLAIPHRPNLSTFVRLGDGPEVELAQSGEYQVKLDGTIVPATEEMVFGDPPR